MIDQKPTFEERDGLLGVLSSGGITLVMLISCAKDIRHHNWLWVALWTPLLIINGYFAYQGWKKWRAERGERIRRRDAFQAWRERLSSVPPPPPSGET